MELCTRCDRLISMREDQGDYFDGKPYCHLCLELITPQEEVA